LSDENKIWPIPPLPKEIKEAVNDDKLAVFIGAGISRIIGCIGWEQLATNLVNRCFSLNLISYKEKQTLLQISDHKKLITICNHILKAEHEDDFFQELEMSLVANPVKVHDCNVYDELYGLRGLFVTTNVDTHFHFKFNTPRIVHRIEELEPSNIDRTKLYHIHGCIVDRESLVLTVRQYVQRYNIPSFVEFIKRILGEYVVLFVGYGTNEFELLDYLIQKHDPNKGRELKHFTLKGFFRGEDSILAYEQSYYSDLGIRVLPFEKDLKGYDQIFEVIKSWNKEINETTTYLHDTHDMIDEVVSNYTDRGAQEIFQIVKHDKSQEDYFFRKLASTNTPSVWLTDLVGMGYFDPVNNPPPIDAADKKSFTISNWKILPYLENLSSHNAAEPNREITRSTIEIVNSIISFRDKEGKRIENSYTDCAIIRTISKLPLSEITREHVKFVRTALDSRHEIRITAGEVTKHLLPKLIDGRSTDLLLALLSVMFQYKKESQYGFTRYTSVLGDFWLGEALKRYKSEISDLCGIQASDQVIELMHSISDADPHSFLVIPTIEDTGQRFQDEYLYQLVNFVRDMYELIESNLLEDRVKRLLNEKHVIFRRIALYIIDKHFGQLGKLFWNYRDNPLDDAYARYELYGLLKSNCRNFSANEMDIVLNWIESANYYIPPEMEEQADKEKRFAYRKKEWLYPLLESGNEKVRLLYEKYDRINPAAPEHPGFVTWTETKFEPVTRVRDSAFENRTNKEIAEYLKVALKGKENDEFLTDQISERFRDAVRDNPEKYSTDMQPFLEIPITFQYSLLLGLSEAWRTGKTFPWNSLLDFMFAIVNSDSFWEQPHEGQLSANPDWIASEIASLIEYGTRNDDHAFAQELLPRAESVLLILVSKSSSTAEDGHELITSVLNSPRGKTFSAMMQLSLRTARVSKQVAENRWVKSIKEDFTLRLDRTFEKSLDFSVVLGQYYQHLMYLDADWAQTNVNRVFPKEDAIHWRAAFSGYLFYTTSLRKAVYFLLRQNEHYAMALRTDFPDGQVAAHLVQHICIGYLRDFETIEDEKGLISKLLNDGTLPQLSEIVGFFWLLRSGLTDEMKSKVKPLWRELYQVLAPKKDDPAYRAVIADLSKWLSLVQDIDDEILEWLLLSAKCFRADYETTFFVEYLSQHAAKSPKQVGKIYLQMIQSGIYPQYEVDHIQQTISTIYGSDRDAADRICNLYSARGIDFLRAIYDEHRKKNTQN
jgi:hypothetical protein